MPTVTGRACATDTQKASTVCPDNVRPLRSVMVTEIMSGRAAPRSSKTSPAAAIAALAFRVSKIVSMSSASQPPSIRPRTCSAYAARSWSNVMARNDGSFTSGESESVRLVGPIDPATRRRRCGVRAVKASAASRASRAAATFIS